MPRGRKRMILGGRLGVLEPTGVQVTQRCPFTTPAGKVSRVGPSSAQHVVPGCFCTFISILYHSAARSLA